MTDSPTASWTPIGLDPGKGPWGPGQGQGRGADKGGVALDGHADLAVHPIHPDARLGFGRVVASAVEAPIVVANLV